MSSQDLSEISFEIIDGERYTAVTSLDQVTFESLPKQKQVVNDGGKALGEAVVGGMVDVTSIEVDERLMPAHIFDEGIEINLAKIHSDPEVYWPYDKVDVDTSSFPAIIDTLVGAYTDGIFRIKTMLGVANSQGVRLSTQQIDELIATIAGDPRITPLESGRFAVKDTRDHKQDNRTSSDSTLPKQLLGKKELQKERKRELLAEQRKMSDTGKKAKADTRHKRKRGPRKGYQGKNHNKRVSIDKLLERMNTIAQDKGKT